MLAHFGIGAEQSLHNSFPGIFINCSNTLIFEMFLSRTLNFIGDELIDTSDLLSDE
jgi:hypothetical protein